MKIMDAIFEGEVYPAEQVVPDDPEYMKTNRQIDALMKKLQEKLSEEDYEMVEEVCDLQANSGSILNREFFRYGLSMGLCLMQEAKDQPQLRFEKEVQE